MSLSRVALQNETSEKTCYKTYNVLQFRQNCIVEYEQAAFNTMRHEDILRENLKKAQITYRGNISHAGQKRLSKIIECWQLAIQMHNIEESKVRGNDYRKLSMITLTLSSVQIHSDKKIKEDMLKPFLRIIRERHGLENYVWKAEKQQNGNIHFHILVDKFIERLKVSEIWNNIQEHLGYLDYYKKKQGHRNAPSTQIESIRAKNDIVKYICKYLSKESEYGLIEGAVWKASKKLYSLDYFTVIKNYNEHESLQKEIENGNCRKKENDNCVIYSFEKLSIVSFLKSHSKEYYFIYVHALAHYLFTDTGFKDFKIYYSKLIDEYNSKHCRRALVEDLVVNRVKYIDATPLRLFEDFEIQQDSKRFR